MAGTPKRPHKPDCQPRNYEGGLTIIIGCTCYPPKFKLYEYGNNSTETVDIGPPPDVWLDDLKINKG